MAYQMAHPNITINKEPIDRSLEIISISLLIILWLMTIGLYFYLPDTIPIHFNIKGEPDNYGSKLTIFLPVIIGTAVFALLTFLNKYPHNFNYPHKITADNATIHYKYATRLLRVMQLLIMLLMAVTILSLYLSVQHNMKGMGIWFMPVFICIMISPTVYYLYITSKIPKSPK